MADDLGTVAARADDAVTARWREVLPHPDEVVVEGELTGDEGVLGRERIDQIAEDLSRRRAELR